MSYELGYCAPTPKDRLIQLTEQFQHRRVHMDLLTLLRSFCAVYAVLWYVIRLQIIYSLDLIHWEWANLKTPKSRLEVVPPSKYAQHLLTLLSPREV